jgi:UDP-N-acetyl-2-amino-2-deoxyglucuronate dehydrogenase
MVKFALIGAAGYVAPKHMKAIKENDCDLVAALDPHDSVGILDSYFPSCRFFSEMERFDRYLEKIKRQKEGINYLSICSPNYLHDAHCRLGLRLGADVLCEKPLVLNPWNLDQLEEIENESRGRIYVVLQLRFHPELLKIKNSLDDKRHSVVIDYITPRGSWYLSSWKGDIKKSGGLITNIGVHLIDMIIWLFGFPERHIIIKNTPNKVAGEIILENADVKFSLSIDRNDLPNNKYSSFRSISINNSPVQLDNVFTDLHTTVYKNMLNNIGFGLSDARPAVELVYNMRRPV